MLGNNETLEDFADLIALILKDRFLREKLIGTPEFRKASSRLAPNMGAVIDVYAQRSKKETRRDYGNE